MTYPHLGPVEICKNAKKKKNSRDYWAFLDKRAVDKGVENERRLD